MSVIPCMFIPVKMWFIVQIIFWNWLGNFDDTTVIDYQMQLDVRKSLSWIKMLSKPNGIKLADTYLHINVDIMFDITNCKPNGIKLPDTYIWNLHINVDIMFDITNCSLRTSQMKFPI